jgi:hypothetical protein
MFFKTRQRLKFLRITLLALLCAAFLANVAWRVIAARDTRELKSLYYQARSGDPDSVKRLEEYHFSKGTELLERIAQDQSIFAETRVMAINALARKRLPNKQVLAGLLWIGQPFVVRHAAAVALSSLWHKS